jgi:hypothetical protein
VSFVKQGKGFCFYILHLGTQAKHLGTKKMVDFLDESDISFSRRAGWEVFAAEQLVIDKKTSPGCCI